MPDPKAKVGQACTAVRSASRPVPEGGHARQRGPYGQFGLLRAQQRHRCIQRRTPKQAMQSIPPKPLVDKTTCFSSITEDLEHPKHASGNHVHEAILSDPLSDARAHHFYIDRIRMASLLPGPNLHGHHAAPLKRFGTLPWGLNIVARPIGAKCGRARPSEAIILISHVVESRIIDAPGPCQLMRAQHTTRPATTSTCHRHGEWEVKLPLVLCARARSHAAATSCLRVLLAQPGEEWRDAHQRSCIGAHHDLTKTHRAQDFSSCHAAFSSLRAQVL